MKIMYGQDVDGRQCSLLREGFALIDYGPVTMTLEAKKKGKPCSSAVVAGAGKVFEFFDILVAHLQEIRTPVENLGSLRDDTPSGIKRMVHSVRMLQEEQFTPLAAVAGTVSDIAVEEMARAGADYAIANNGGDVAWRVSGAEKIFLSVGLISDIQSGIVTHKLENNARDRIRGLATSGFGGRSLTRGVASAVTALAATSSRADAAATSIANSCFCEDPAVVQCLAEELDYDTDIRGLTVTKSVGTLDRDSVNIALNAGVNRARELMEKGLILGAILFVSSRMALVSNGASSDFFKVSAIPQ